MIFITSSIWLLSIHQLHTISEARSKAMIELRSTRLRILESSDWSMTLRATQGHYSRSECFWKENRNANVRIHLHGRRHLQPSLRPADWYTFWMTVSDLNWNTLIRTYSVLPSYFQLVVGDAFSWYKEPAMCVRNKRNYGALHLASFNPLALIICVQSGLHTRTW